MQSSQLSRLRAHFHKDLRRQLYGDEDDVAFFDIIKKQLKEIEKRLEDGRAALQVGAGRGSGRAGTLVWVPMCKCAKGRVCDWCVCASLRRMHGI